MKYEPTIGLEIHAELKTRTKMFCDSLNDPDEQRPNVNVCPVCMGHPGTLPTINKKAVESVIRVGLALGGAINEVTKFDRKNYFYPDIPKAFQISQFDKPLVVGGELKGVRLRRIHLEEDTGSLVHDSEKGSSLVDYNRSSCPLMELVTEPDIRSAEQAMEFGRELQLILRYLGVSGADMEKGQMRLEANISLNMGTKVEVKNINSFRAMGLAINYELKRQEEAIEKGERIIQETRGWDELRQRTVSQRTKEEAHDYRYFPEPDLPPFETSIFNVENLRAEIPELPQMKRERFGREYGLDEKQADNIVSEPKLAEYFEEAVSELAEFKSDASVKNLYNYLTSDLKGLMNETGSKLNDLKINPEHFAHLVALMEQGKIMSRQAKDILRKMYETGSDPEEILESEGLHTVSDEGELEKAIEDVIAANPKAVADFRAGKQASVQFLIGQTMAKLRGRGRPDAIREIILKKLS